MWVTLGGTGPWVRWFSEAEGIPERGYKWRPFLTVLLTSETTTPALKEYLYTGSPCPLESTPGPTQNPFFICI